MFARGGAFPCDLSFLAVFAGFFLALISDYFEDFKSADAEKLYTKIDSNGDGKTWSYVASDHCMRTNYSSASADDDHYYNVTAVFTEAQGNVTESSFSNTASLSLSIEAIENAMNASSYDVYTLDGQAVMLNAKSLKGLKKGAYIINDRKFILK